jgi:oligoendopeptidase F
MYNNFYQLHQFLILHFLSLVFQFLHFFLYSFYYILYSIPIVFAPSVFYEQAARADQSPPRPPRGNKESREDYFFEGALFW